MLLGDCLDWVGLDWEIDGFDGGFEREDLAVWVIN
jgi:hypothetical protein